ncbi:hypothetical protein AB0A71_24475 [Kitasatospora aureofaciens]|uniref:hypothetical protein n=1 Tax=Kitasatospora aureofaciens TaxID=1894 RepID=UPI0033D81C8F
MEDPDFTVLLAGNSPHDPTALKAVRTVTGLSLWRSRQLLDRAPATVQSGIPFDIFEVYLDVLVALSHVSEVVVDPAERHRVHEAGFDLPARDGSPWLLPPTVLIEVSANESTRNGTCRALTQAARGSAVAVRASS